jgi:hypothetical protein
MTVPEQWLLIFYVANQVASALIQALPAPNGNPWYNFFYKFLSLLIADFKSFSATFPKPQLSLSSNLLGQLTPKQFIEMPVEHIQALSDADKIVTDQTAGR